MTDLMQSLRLCLVASLFLSACVTYRKPIPAITPLSSSELVEAYRLSGKARQIRFASLVVDLPIGYEIGESNLGIGGACTKRFPV
jgi:hypothetical protein